VHYFSLFDFLMARFNWATILVCLLILVILGFAGGRRAAK
jgi:hypothetical protein